jgi:hypothetical protein
MTTTILKSSIPSHGLDVSKSKFLSGNNFSQGIDSAELMPELVFVNLLRSPGIDSPDRYDNLTVFVVEACQVHGWRNRFLGSLNVYIYGLCGIRALDKVRQFITVSQSVLKTF